VASAVAVPLILIRGRQVERVFDVADFGRVGNDLDDIKPKGDIRHAEHSEPCHRRPHQQAPFFAIHSGQRAPEFLGGACLDLNKNQYVLIAANEVNFLPSPRTEVAAEDPESRSLEKPRRGGFPLPAKDQMGRPACVRS